MHKILKDENMIDIAFDIHEGNTFCGEECSVVTLDNAPQTWEEYVRQAEDLINRYGDNKTIILQINNPQFSMNKFSLALFVGSIKLPCKLELAVFKVKDLEEAREAYKPYLSLTIAVKYVLQLFDSTPEEIYKNISGLGYLGLSIKTDYIENTMSLVYEGAKEPSYHFETDNAFDALVMSAVLKTVSLAQIKAKFEVKMALNFIPPQKTIDNLISQILKIVSPWVEE